jgi:integrase
MNGKPLLSSNPLKGIKFPVEKNPRRPVETYDRFMKLMKVAEEIDWRLPPVLSLIESTGQRISAIVKLQRRDFVLDRLPHGWIFFRGENQKNGFDHWVPLDKASSLLIQSHLKRISKESTAPIFPADKDTSKPTDRWYISRRLRLAYEEAELVPFAGGLWHPFRRKFAVERKHLPVKDVASAGGWRETRTLLGCYQQPDDITIQQVVLDAPKLYADGLRVTPNTTPNRKTKTKKKQA